MKDDDEKGLPEEIAGAMLTATAPVDPGAEAADRMKRRLLDRVHRDDARLAEQFVTVRGETGAWTETSPGNSIRMLRGDDETVSILVRLEPGTTYPGHYHPADEETYVIEGETMVGDIHLVAWDFHFAPKGTRHGAVHSETGCVLLIRKARE